MGKLGAFLEIERVEQPERDPRGRTVDHGELFVSAPTEVLRDQGARCMDCGVPFCHHGCPLGNLIPDWNDLVYKDRWREAIDQLHATNNFPEFTGKLCPAPCEAACVLEIREGDAVTIKQIEAAIVDRAWAEGWVAPRPARVRTGHSVAVVGSGPAGLAAAQQLVRAGHGVVVYERDEAGGGLCRFGVPDFKIEKWTIDRRLAQLEAEGVGFRYGVDVGVDLSVEELRAAHDAVVIATGSRVHRELGVDGAHLDGVHPAMDYLYGRGREVAGGPPSPVSARGKHVVVIGGGDTAADCMGYAHREGAASVTQFDVYAEPPTQRPDDRTPWPRWPAKLRLTYALKEGGEREFAVSTTGLSGEDGRVQRVHYVRNAGTKPFAPIPGSDATLPADLVLVAIGFTGPEPLLLDALGVERDARGNVKAGTYASSVDGVFAAGDARRGQSLIVWAINEGRQCARMVERHLAGLPPRDPGPDPAPGAPQSASYTTGAGAG